MIECIRTLTADNLKDVTVASKIPPLRLEPEIWARKTANRLRLIQSSFLDQGQEQRRLYLEEEIEFALDEIDTVASEDRQRFLSALEDCFPTFVESSAGTSRADAPVAHLQKEDALESVLSRLPGLDEEGRKRVLSVLGVEFPAPSGSSGEGASARFSAKVRLPERADEIEDFERGIQQLYKGLLGVQDDGARMEFSRVVKLLGILGIAFRDLHQFVWEFWRQTASRDLQSTWRSTLHGPFEDALRDYLHGSGEVGSREVADEVERTKRLMLGICFAVRRGAEEFGRSHHQVFAPDNIENAVLIEQDVVDASKVKELPRKSWEKYRQLCRHLTPDSIDSEFGRIFSSVISAWLRSRT